MYLNVWKDMQTGELHFIAQDATQGPQEYWSYLGVAFVQMQFAGEGTAASSVLKGPVSDDPKGA